SNDYCVFKGRLNNVILFCNNNLSNLGTLNIGNSIYIVDSRIRFKLENIYFHPHTADINFTSASTVYNKYVINDFDNLGLTTDEKNNTQHILIIKSTT
ncbi:MAG: hypothetical protein QMD02_05860, partial [Bacteroidales bacterium]|nr:hypothetical protein [Bacteroidales bacterium]